MDELKVFTGSAHPALAKSVCDYLGIPLGEAEVFEFSNENIFVRILSALQLTKAWLSCLLCLMPSGELRQGGSLLSSPIMAMAAPIRRTSRECLLLLA